MKLSSARERTGKGFSPMPAPAIMLAMTKSCHERLAGSPALIERLRREAQTAAALNHPNILTIYEFGRQGDLQYIVSEFVDGISLREYIGNLSPQQSLDYARQIALALEAS